MDYSMNNITKRDQWKLIQVIITKNLFINVSFDKVKHVCKVFDIDYRINSIDSDHFIQTRDLKIFRMNFSIVNNKVFRVELR